MANHDLPVKCNIFAIRAEGIVRDLTKMARRLLRDGYGTANLVFSDWSFVSLTDSGVISEVVDLLQAGHQPLGFIAPDSTRNRNPFVGSRQMGNNSALAELYYLALSIFGHLLPARNSQLATMNMNVSGKNEGTPSWQTNHQLFSSM